MLSAYVVRNGSVVSADVSLASDLPQPCLWADALAPTPEEIALIERSLGLHLPTHEEMREIEPSNRLYVENGAIFMTATVIVRADEPNPSNDVITFVLARGTLVTVRYYESKAIPVFAQRLTRQAQVQCEDVLLGLLEALVNRIADILEKMSVDLDGISRIIFDDRPGRAKRRSGEARDLQVVLKMLGRNEDLASTGRESLMGLDRMARFLMNISNDEAQRFGKERKARLKTLTRDVHSLNEYATFENNKIFFLLDATLGMINIEQNRIIKLFSVAAVVFLPPTLIASVYGMNFDVMPELKWVFGYPAALAAMVLSAVLPYWFFKRKGWF
jgi:magnesium transporter